MRNASTHLRQYKSAGFTLIELMVTVAIIGIIAAVAIPNYQNYVIRSKRSAAEQYMLSLANKQEQYVLDKRAYANTEAALGFTTPSDVSAQYTITIDNTTPSPGYTITAAPKASGTQVSDGTLTLDSTGAKTPTGKW